MLVRLYVLVYPFAMKYLAIIVLVILLVRVDVLLGLFDKLGEKFAARSPEIPATELTAPVDTIPLNKDQSFKQTPRQVFLALLEDFHADPQKEIRLKALDYFKNHPTIFTQKLDTDLEAAVFRWRDLLNLNEPELANFLIDLLNILQGENQIMVKRFFALWMDINMEHFLTAYSKTKDTNCLIATTFGDPIPEEERLNEYYDREDALKAFLAKENINPVEKTLATNCQLVLGLEISKIAPPSTNETLPPATDPGTTP